MQICQKIVIFIEPNDEAFITPFKLGNLFMNRFAIDEAEGYEILKICELEKQLNMKTEEIEKMKGTGRGVYALPGIV